MKSKKNLYYAYLLSATGEMGVVDSWSACETAVKGRQARFKGFMTRVAAEAWLAAGARYEIKIKPNLEAGIYFDAGTGRGDGVEVSVTDMNGKDLLAKILSKSKINKYGKYNAVGVTNNYGELLGCKFALQIAMQKGAKKIFGDSKLVIDYWSKGFIKKEISVATRKLAFEVVELREKFENAGGKLRHISGDHNPADLGFH
ncbi:MAG: viroplasmin family protein [bacterium]|nr:viroplasmin family protein [bacterium]